jgi:hypothetical protein
MPIRAYLGGQKFDGETIRLMGVAFEMALASLRPTPDFDDPIRAALAQSIIALAKAGEQSALLIHLDGAADRRGAKPPKPKLSPLIPALFSAPRQRPCSRDATRRADSRGRHNNGSTVDHRSRDGAPNARRTESKASGACLRSRYGLHGAHCRSSA